MVGLARVQSSEVRISEGPLYNYCSMIMSNFQPTSAQATATECAHSSASHGTPFHMHARLGKGMVKSIKSHFWTPCPLLPILDLQFKWLFSLPNNGVYYRQTWCGLELQQLPHSWPSSSTCLFHQHMYSPPPLPPMYTCMHIPFVIIMHTHTHTHSYTC